MSCGVLRILKNEDSFLYNQHVLVFDHLHSKNVFLCLNRIASTAICAYCLSLGTKEMNLTPLFSYPPVRYLYILI